MPFRVVIGNNKGGSEKTATTVNLSAALAEDGHRVLVVDVDAQANASRRLGHPYNPEGVAGDAIVACGWGGEYSERIHLIPSRFDLENELSRQLMTVKR